MERLVRRRLGDRLHHAVHAGHELHRQLQRQVGGAVLLVGRGEEVRDRRPLEQVVLCTEDAQVGALHAVRVDERLDARHLTAARDPVDLGGREAAVELRASDLVVAAAAARRHPAAGHQ